MLITSAAAGAMPPKDHFQLVGGAAVDIKCLARRREKYAIT